MLEPIFESDYQDIYRLKKGLRLYVNKYAHVLDDFDNKIVICTPNYLSKKIFKCSDIRELLEDCKDMNGNPISKGSFVCRDYLIQPLSEEFKIYTQYTLKFQDKQLHFNRASLIEFLNDVEKIVNKEKCGEIYGNCT